MDKQCAEQFASELPSDACVIDVGGGMAPFARADWVIDAVDYKQRGRLDASDCGQSPSRYSEATWVRFDICSRQPWPFEDKQFDFATCSHVLEDVRDPIWVCSEMSRIAKAGYIETPSRAVEQSLGIEHPRLAGYYHHRWLVSERDRQLEFRLKPHLLHVTRGAIVARVGFWRAINPAHGLIKHFWRDEISCSEVLEFEEQQVVQELCDYSQQIQRLPDLLVRSRTPWPQRLRRSVYQLKLALGGGL